MLKFKTKGADRDFRDRTGVPRRDRLGHDPTADEDGYHNPISFGFEFNLEEVKYLNKFLEAFINHNT